MLKMGTVCRPSVSTSSAFFWNLTDDRSIIASLLSRMYRSSLAGKLEQRGTATLLLPRIESRVTVANQSESTVPGSFTRRTHIVVAVFHQESDPLTIQGVPGSGLAQLIS